MINTSTSTAAYTAGWQWGPSGGPYKWLHIDGSALGTSKIVSAGACSGAQFGGMLGGRWEYYATGLAGAGYPGTSAGTTPGWIFRATDNACDSGNRTEWKNGLNTDQTVSYAWVDTLGGSWVADPSLTGFFFRFITLATMPEYLVPDSAIQPYSSQINRVSSLPFIASYSGSGFRVATGGMSPSTRRYWDNALFPGAYPMPGVGQTKAPCAEGASHATDPSACLDDVDTATGAFTSAATDFSLPGIGLPLVLTRSYSSNNTSSGRFGLGWTDSLAAHLTVLGSGDVLLSAEDGQEITFLLQPGGGFKAAGATSTLTSGGGGYTLVTSDQIHYVFNSSGALQSIKDRNSQGLTLTYDGSGCLATVTDSAARVITATCSGGHVTRLTLPDGRHVDYAYTGSLLTSVTDMRGGGWSYNYDVNNRLTKITDPNSHAPVQDIQYDSNGRVKQKKDALSNTTTFTWDPLSQTSKMTDPRGKVWTDVYANNILVSRTDPLGNTTTYSQDSELNDWKVTDPRGKTTTSTYDDHGNILTRIGPAPSSVSESWTYDSLNDATSYTNGRGNQTTYGYDSAGNLTSKTQPGSLTTIYTRDPAGTGLLTALTDPRGKTTHYGYDSAGNQTSITSPLGEEATMSYDSSGRLTSRVDPRGNATGATPSDYETQYTYDNLDRKLTETDPLGHQTQWAYDPAGNLTSTTDADSNTTVYTYDARNALKTVTAPGGTDTTTYNYDANGNRTSRVDANNHTTSYTYDDANQLASTTNPLSKTWQYSYDANGNRTQTVAPNGTTTKTYDELNRLKTIAYSDSTPGVTYSYDANSNRTQMIDGAGTQTSTYDALDRLTAATRGTNSFGYSYDDAGNITQRVYPDSTTTDYTYDDDSRLTTATSAGATTSYSYDAASNQTGMTRPTGNGWNEARIYDRAGRLTQLKDANATSTLQQLDYAYNNVNKATSLTRLSGSENYQYDNHGRLTKVCYNAGCSTATDTIAWTYDSVGNRLTETRPAGTTTYTYNAGDQLTQTSGPSGTTSFGYDNNGNETSAGSATYTYDLANRETGATSGATTTSYSVDGDGDRVTQTTGSSTLNYLWDNNNPLPELALETDASGTTIRAYIRGTDTIAMLESSSTWYFHHDRLGSVTALTSSSGATEWTYQYEPYGAFRSQNKVDPSAPVNPLDYVGQYDDSTTGLLNLRARQYDPALGRFLSVDPVTEGSLNNYDYAGQDPINSYDLDGRFPSLGGISKWAGTVSAVAGGITVLCAVCAPVTGPIALVSGGVAIVADVGKYAKNPTGQNAAGALIDVASFGGGAATEKLLAGKVSKQVAGATGIASGTAIAIIGGTAANVKPAPKAPAKKKKQPQARPSGK